MSKSKKSFDIEELSKEQVDILSIKIGEQVRDLCDKAVIKANKILNKYGMECKMGFQIKELGTFEEKRSAEQKKDNLITNTQ